MGVTPEGRVGVLRFLALWNEVRAAGDRVVFCFDGAPNTSRRPGEPMSTIHNRGEAMAWQTLHDASAPRPGDEAPDFELGDVSGEHRFRLSSYRGARPVVLIFGSFT